MHTAYLVQYDPKIRLLQIKVKRMLSSKAKARGNKAILLFYNGSDSEVWKTEILKYLELQDSILKTDRVTGVLQILQVVYIDTLFLDSAQGGDRTSEKNGNVISKTRPKPVQDSQPGQNPLYLSLVQKQQSC